MSENQLMQPPEDKPVIKEDKPVIKEENTKTEKQKNITGIVAAVMAVQIVLAVLLGSFLFKRGYQSSKDNTANTIRKGAYDAVYNMTEEAHHVSNRITISVEGIREKADLEVLKINSSYFYTANTNNKEVWYKIPGKGTFTVDMRMTEFIVDNERQHVLVKVPAPAITQFREDYDGIDKLLYKDGGFFNNGSISEGEQIAQNMLAQAHVQMMKKFEMTPAYYQTAKDSAARLITIMIKALNPDAGNLTVEVVFNEESVG